MVTLQTRHHMWFKHFEHMNLTVGPEHDAKCYSLTDKPKEFPRTLWYSRCVIDGEWQVHGDPVGSLPEKILHADKCPELPERYVLLAPFCSTPDKEWSITHWRLLVHLLIENGHKVVVIGTPTDQERLKAGFTKSGATYFWGFKPDWTARAIINADLVVGNDSAITAVAGLYRRPTVALCAQYQDDYPLDGTVKTLYPPKRTSCSPCNGARFSACTSCSAMQLISPFDVADAALEQIEGAKVESIPSQAGGRKVDLSRTFLRWVQQAEIGAVRKPEEKDGAGEEGGRSEAGAVRPEGLRGLHSTQEPGASEELPGQVGGDQRQKRKPNKGRQV